MKRIIILACICSLAAAWPIRQTYGNEVAEEFTLHEAVKAAAIKLVRALIDQGADVTAMDKLGLTPLHYAAFGAKWQLAEQRSVNYDGDSPLPELLTRIVEHDPAYGKIAQMLIEAGVDVDIRSGEGRTTPLTLACLMDNSAVAELLLEKGAEPEPATLAAAVVAGNIELVTHMIERGMSVNAPVEGYYHAPARGIAKSYEAIPLTMPHRSTLQHTTDVSKSRGC